MKKQYLDADYRLSGDRIVELGWVRSRLKDVRNCRVADFGTIVRTRYGPRIGWSSYSLHPSNDVTAYDVDDVPALADRYRRVDLLHSASLPSRAYDVGVCLSSLEHFGLAKYASEHHNMKDGDVIGLRSILKSIKPNGTLLLTVPAGRGIIMNRYIREYSPEQLGRLLRDAKAAKHTIEYYFWDSDEYWYLVDRRTLVKEKSKEPEEQTVTTGLACIKITNGGSA